MELHGVRAERAMYKRVSSWHSTCDVIIESTYSNVLQRTGAAMTILELLKNVEF